jgi:hypothetical protein
VLHIRKAPLNPKEFWLISVRREAGARIVTGASAHWSRWAHTMVGNLMSPLFGRSLMIEGYFAWLMYMALYKCMGWRRIGTLSHRTLSLD